MKANPGSIYMPLLSSFCMTLIQYIISGRNSTDSSLGIDKHCLKDSLAFRHLYRSGVFRGWSCRFWLVSCIICRISIRYFNLNLLGTAVLSGWRRYCRCILNWKFYGIWFPYRETWNAGFIYRNCIDSCVTFFNLDRSGILAASCCWFFLILCVINFTSGCCRQL